MLVQALKAVANVTPGVWLDLPDAEAHSAPFEKMTVKSGEIRSGIRGAAAVHLRPLYPGPAGQARLDRTPGCGTWEIAE
jgi:hypothetical protein